MRHYLFFLVILLSGCAHKNKLTDLQLMGLNESVKRIKYFHFENSEYKKNKNFETHAASKEEVLVINNEYIFNEVGMVEEKREYYFDELRWIYIFNYGKNSLLKYKDQYDVSGEIITRTKYENTLDRKGKLVKQIEYRALANISIDTTDVIFSQFPERITYINYDSSGSLKNTVELKRSMSMWKNITSYKQGQITQHSTVEIKNDSTIFSDRFECLKFDDKSNCVKYKSLSEDNSESYINVEIEYYK
jgi:hypothetical protein